MLCAALTGCGGAGSSTGAADRPAADVRPASHPRDREVRALQTALLERLRVVDPDAAGTEHAIYDAHAQARIAGDQVFIDIAGPGAPLQKKARRTARYAGIETQILSSDVSGRGYQFACRPEGFGDRKVHLAFVSRPRRVIPAVHRLLMCAGGSAVTDARRPAMTGKEPGRALSQPPAVRLGRWTIRVRVIAPRSSGSITFDAGLLRPVEEHSVEHELVITNTGRRPVALADTRSSRLLGARGRREPLAADEGCGYAQNGPGAAIEPNACRSNLDAFVVPAGRTVIRTITLSWNLPGAGRLAPGTYMFRRPVRFAAGRRAPDGGRGHTAVVRLAYTVNE